MLFDIDPLEKTHLDSAEGVGHGYAETNALVLDNTGNRHLAFMYVAETESIDDSLLPYACYKRFVLEGARQHKITGRIIAQIEAMPATEDPDKEREWCNRQIVC